MRYNVTRIVFEIRMRLKDKIAIVVGAGQSPGEGLGNGRATVLSPAKAELRSRPNAMPGSRCVTRWGPRQISLPALRCRSMVARL
jgi:hypothetical protein